tara:strand:+ start:247 stop:1287 length:1041 start_codon:yes stop_codon:yes gene_type:complete
MIKTIATLGSHCALQLLKGAKDEGFSTLLVTKQDRQNLYNRFKFIDNMIQVKKFSDIVSPTRIRRLKQTDSILIPHGTLISEVGVDAIEESLPIPVFGNRYILRWEADRLQKEKLMKAARLNLPKSYNDPSEIDRLVIAKLSGAAGGRGYFLATNTKSYEEKLAALRSDGLIRNSEEENVYIQEYIKGVPVYLQYFFSPLSRELEFFGIDRRYETNVDGLGRIPASAQIEMGTSAPSYIVVGNSPLVLRESLLDEVYKIGERFVRASQVLVPPGIVGPFCIEGIYDGDGKFVSFEFSGRIVAGTNLFIEGSPYTALLYDTKMSMGRRIALEVRRAIEANQVELITT